MTSPRNRAPSKTSPTNAVSGSPAAPVDPTLVRAPMALLAQGINYFGPDGFPVTVRRVTTRSDARPSHPHDVTLVEHYHDFTELVIVCSGQGLHVLEGESFP